MTTVNEEVAGSLWLRSYLEADTELAGMVNVVALRSVSTQIAPPYVKIDRQEAEDLMSIGLHRVWANMLFLVRGITQGPDWDEVQAIADRLDELLHDHEEAAGGLRYHLFREETFTDETIEGGDYYLHAGGMYRIRASTA